jgi:hypothetical protein
LGDSSQFRHRWRHHGHTKLKEPFLSKSIVLLVRKADTSPEAFKQQLTGEFAVAAQAVPGVRGLIVHEIVREMIRADIPTLLIGDTIDAIVEWWADEAATRDALLAQLPGSVTRLKAFLVEEDVIIPFQMPRADIRIKTMAFLCRKEGELLPAFRHHWHDGHGGMARVVPYLQGFILNDICGTQERTDVPAIDFGKADGVAEGWLESPEAQQLMVATPEAKTWFKDGSQTFGQIKSFLTREIVLIDPP